MAGFMDLFRFKSKEEEAREQEEFRQRVFPLGMEQRDAAWNVLMDMLPEKKHHREYMFAYVVAKDVYTQDEMTDEAYDAAMAKMGKHKWLPERTKKLIMALIQLDCRTASLENYPTAQDVLAFAGEAASS